MNPSINYYSSSPSSCRNRSGSSVIDRFSEQEEVKSFEDVRTVVSAPPLSTLVISSITSANNKFDSKNVEQSTLIKCSSTSSCGDHDSEHHHKKLQLDNESPIITKKNIDSNIIISKSKIDNNNNNNKLKAKSKITISSEVITTSSSSTGKITSELYKTTATTATQILKGEDKSVAGTITTNYISSSNRFNQQQQFPKSCISSPSDGNNKLDELFLPAFAVQQCSASTTAKGKVITSQSPTSSSVPSSSSSSSSGSPALALSVGNRIVTNNSGNSDIKSKQTFKSTGKPICSYLIIIIIIIINKNDTFYTSQF